MEFRINKNDLLALLSKVAPALDDGKVIPIYADILVEVYTNGLSFSTSSADMQMKSFFPLECDEAAAFGVNGKIFSELVKNLPDGEIKFAIKDSNTLKLSIGRKYLNLNIKPAEDFPLSPRYDSSRFIPVSGFMESIHGVAYAVGSDESRPQFMCILVNQEDFVSTDGFRMAVKKHNFPVVGEFLIPAKSLTKISKVFKEEVEIFLDMESNYFHIKKDLTACSIRTVSKDYIKYKQLVPSGPHDIATVNKQELLDALRLMSAVSDPIHKATLEFKPGNLRISKKDHTVGEVQDDVVIDFHADVTLGANCAFMTTMLNHVESDIINIELYGNLRPMLVREGDNAHVLMPQKPAIGG